MKMGFLGNGKLARVLGAAFQRAGHEVRFGARDPSSPSATTDHPAIEAGAKVCAIDNAAAFGDVVVLAINPWTEIEGVLRSFRHRLEGKVLVDPSNDIDFSSRPVLASSERSLGQRVQQWAPSARVVKTLNFIPTNLMVDPTAQGIVPAMMWVAGDDANAKRVTSDLLRDLGWSEVIDLGGIERSRFQESIGLIVSRVVTDLLRAAH